MKASFLLVLAVSLVFADAYQDTAMTILVKSVEKALKHQLPSGRFVASTEDAKKNPEDYIYFLTRLKAGYVHDSYLLLPCAYLYAAQSPLNPLFKDARLIKAMEKNLEFLDTTFSYTFHTHRLCAFLALAYEMVEKDLSGKHRALLLALLKRGTDEIASRAARAAKHTGRYTAMDIGINTNHWAIYNLHLLRCGKIFNDKAMVEAAKKQFKGIIAAQQPEGYWNEWNGPTPSYNPVTAYALAGYYAFSRDPLAPPALKRAAQFQIWFTYPNGNEMEAMDGRVQMSWGPNVCGHDGFSHSAEGRRFSRLLLEKRLKMSPDKIFDPEECALLVENCLFWESGPEVDLPVEKGDFAYRLKDAAGVRRSGPWLAGYSSIGRPSWPENQFYLDRQVHFSLWHDSAGLVLIGPNSKGHQRGGTFYMNRNLDQAVGYLKSGLLRQDAKAGDLLTGTYDGFSSELVLRPVNAKEFEITGRVKLGSNPTALFTPEFTLQLFLNLAKTDTIETEKGGKIALSGEYRDYPPYKVGKWIKKGRWKLEIPENSRFIFPYYAFYPYSLYGVSPYQQPEGVAVITFPSPEAEMKCRLVVE